MDNNSEVNVGDVVICINVNNIQGNNPGGEPPRLRLNTEYIVNKIKVCECGSKSLDVGLALVTNSKGVLCQCGGTSSPTTGIHWAHVSRFVKKKELVKKQEASEVIDNVIILDELLEESHKPSMS